MRAIVLADGLEGLTMRRVADAIEYSPTTIYLHFPGRDEITVELMQDALRRLLTSFRPLAAIADPVERAAQIGLAYVRFGIENPETYRPVFMNTLQLLWTAMHGIVSLHLTLGDMRDGRARDACLKPLFLPFY